MEVGDRLYPASLLIQKLFEGCYINYGTVYIKGDDTLMERNLINCGCKHWEFFNNNYIPMLILDVKTGDIDDVNLAACNYYNYAKDEMLSMNIRDISASGGEKISIYMEEVKNGKRKSFKSKHRTSDGTIKDVEVYGGFIQDKGRNLLFFIVHDMEEKIQLEEGYMLNKVYFDNLFQNSPEAIAILDRNFNVVNVNGNFQRLFQYDLGELKGEDLAKFICECRSWEICHCSRESLMKGKIIKKELKGRRKDGNTIDVLLLGLPLIYNGEIIGAYYIYSDISEAKRREEQVKWLTRKDVLTGLYNRKAFLKALDNEILRSDSSDAKNRFAILILNINEFREINEALGYIAGDEVLKQFGSRLKGSVGSNDIVARFEKDHFAVLVPNMDDLDSLKGRIDIILDSLSNSFVVDDNEFQITTSMGISIFPDDGRESTSLLRKANIAMHRSKVLGINESMIYQDSLDKETQEYFWMKNDLAKAISKGELFLHYQPIYDIEINRLIGVEALLRWDHREKGIISPVEFIPLAERTGLIHSIGDWVLMNACQQNKIWQEQGYRPIYVSVNISILQLEQPGFYEMVERILKESKLDPKYLHLEITETFFAQKYQLVQRAVKRLSRLGIKLSIDDFGTGYSSLSQLCQFNIHNLKIDRSFINGVDSNVNKSKIVKAVISLANSLGVGLTAEGVETREQLKFLKQNRCTVAQGYLFSRPIGADEIEKVLAKS